MPGRHRELRGGNGASAHFPLLAPLLEVARRLQPLPATANDFRFVAFTAAAYVMTLTPLRPSLVSGLFVTLAFALTFTSRPAGARAADSSFVEVSGDSPSEPSTRSRFEGEPYPFSVAARAFIAPPLGIAGLGAGLDAAYSVLPYLAIGGQYLTFAVDQGADPDYCERCIRKGSGALAFAEGRLGSRGWATPYARFGLGLLHLSGQRFAYERGYSEDALTLASELGLDLHYRAASLRVFAFQLATPNTELDSDLFAGFGAQLGARF